MCLDRTRKNRPCIPGIIRIICLELSEAMVWILKFSLHGAGNKILKLPLDGIRIFHINVLQTTGNQRKIEYISIVIRKYWIGFHWFIMELMNIFSSKVRFNFCRPVYVSLFTISWIKFYFEVGISHSKSYTYYSLAAHFVIT